MKSLDTVIHETLAKKGAQCVRCEYEQYISNACLQCVDGNMHVLTDEALAEIEAKKRAYQEMFERREIAEADIVTEYLQATERYGPMASAHEGYAVILEELDELKAEVWKNPTKRSMARMRKEAIQVAATAMRFVVDVCDVK